MFVFRLDLFQSAIQLAIVWPTSAAVSPLPNLKFTFSRWKAERESERERERDKERERDCAWKKEAERPRVCVSVCVCMCVWERDPVIPFCCW